MSVQDALEVLRQYPSKTVRRFDVPRCTPGIVTEAEIARTRAVRSRISKQEGRWFITRSSSANWQSVPWSACLRDADPEVEGGLYDGAVSIYNHFGRASTRPRRVSTGKVSKVLHLKYPDLVPILDTRLRRRYSVAARQAAKNSPRFSGQFRRLYWAAIRVDMLASDFQSLRRALARTSDHRLTFLQVTDLRLLDALAWSPR